MISYDLGAGGRVHTNLHVALSKDMRPTFEFTLWSTLTINCTLSLTGADRVRACLCGIPPK